MTTPIKPPAWQPSPYMIRVKKNEQCRFCTCGNTASPPLCDKPCEQGITIQFERKQWVWACGCGLSSNYPFCDGSHPQKNVL